MINTSVCPCCKNPVLANGYVSCQNSDCTEHGIKYLHHEFLEMVEGLNQIGPVIEESITNG